VKGDLKMSKRKKLVLSVVAVICAISVGIGGTLMLFTDVTDVATNVVTFANKPLKVVLQETGWADRDHDGVSDFSDAISNGLRGDFIGGGNYINEETLSDDQQDLDKDGYWEYTYPGDWQTPTTPKTTRYNEKIGIGPYQGTHPTELTENKPTTVNYGDWGYQTINDKAHDAPSADETVDEIDFLGIEFPNNLLSYDIVDKAPRVVHVSGVDTWLRVMAQMVMYEYDTDTDTKTWKMLTLQQTNSALNGSGASKERVAAAEFFLALVRSANTNQKNWEFAPVTAQPAQGYYYYIDNSSNYENIVREETLVTNENSLFDLSNDITTAKTNPNPPGILFPDLRHLALSDELADKHDNIATSNPLAVFGGDDFATAPLFTRLVVPDIDNALAAILQNYKFVIRFQAQVVQKEGNGKQFGWGTSYTAKGTGFTETYNQWATYFTAFSDINDLSKKITLNLSGAANLPDDTDGRTKQDNTPGLYYPYKEPGTTSTISEGEL
jgi:predicted ribosomally synthesized peptide with SipW-like signal peptide